MPIINRKIQHYFYIKDKSNYNYIDIIERMSDYSQTVIYQDQQNKFKQLFNYDTSLLRGVETINDWKQNLGLPLLQYLQKESKYVQKQFELFSCGKQMRTLAFCKCLEKGFSQLPDKYTKAYAAADTANIKQKIQQLDLQLNLLVKYLHIVQTNNVLNTYTQLCEDGVGNIYINLRKVVDYCVDLDTLWLTLLTPKMFRQDQKDALYKLNYGGSLLYYEKQILYMLDRIKRADVKGFLVFPKNKTQLLLSISLIVSSEKLKQNLKTKIVSLLKGQYYASIQNKTLKEQFILSSLQMYHGDQVSQIWDYQRYQDLCIKTLKKSFHDKEYLDCMLYMQPQNINFQRRKRTLELAQIYYALIERVISLRQPNKKTQQSIQIPDEFMMAILQTNKIQLIGHLFVNFLLSNKNALSLNSPQLDKLLFGIIQDLKKIYLAFGSGNWDLPSAILSAITNRFFGKFSQDIKQQIVQLLPLMIKHLGEDKVPNVPQIVVQTYNYQSGYHCRTKKVSREEQLVAIFYFIKDAEYKDQDFYLDLPQVTPTNFETAVMFIRSLQLKLRHHQPTQDQKKLWIMIIQESVYEYKIKVDLKWFKPKRRLDVQQRQGQFLIQKQIKQKWAYDLLQQALNYRDSMKYDQLTQNKIEGEISIQGDIISYFKYAVGMQIDTSHWSGLLQDYQLFSLLQRMRNLLDINFGDVVHLSPDQKVTLNQLYLCLKFYNTKIQRAKGNQVYTLIVYKIIVPWMQSNDKIACQQFKQKFPQFFQSFILEEYYLPIGEAIVTNLSTFQGKNNDLKNKIMFYLDIIDQNTVVNNSLDVNAELLQKIYSVLNDTIDSETLIGLFILIIRFIQFQPDLENQYVALGFLLDYVREDKKLTQFIQKVDDLGDRQKKKINIQIVKKLPQIFNQVSISNINNILLTYFGLDNKTQKALEYLDSIPPEQGSLRLYVLKTLLSQKIRQQKTNQNQGKMNEALQKQFRNSTLKYWKQLQAYADANLVQRKKQQQEVNLATLTQVFQDDALKRIKQEYRKLLQTLNKKKSSKKKSQKKQVEDLASDQDEKFKLARIWRKVVKNYGTFQDIILFGQDPLESGGAYEHQVYQNCLKVIQQRNIQQKYLKRIIRKLPILQKCAEDAIKKIQQQGTQIQQNVQPQLLCKLIMINSRYKSDIIQKFILKNIHKIPIPIKIYQDYLALDLKNKLQSLPKDIVSKMLYNQLGQSTSRKIDQIFDMLIYLPIKKFQNIYLKFENKIEEKQQGEGQNQQWQTQSQKQQDDEQQEDENQDQTGLEKKKSKKKSLKQQQKQLDNDIPLGQQDADQQQFDSQDQDEYGESVSEEPVDQPKIVDMFYQQHNKDLPKYKQLIKIREQLNVSFRQNYLSQEKLQDKLKQEPELEKKVFRVVDILQNQISQPQIVTQILNKMPNNLYQLLKKFGLTKARKQQNIQKYRKQVVKMPRFIKDYMSDRDQNSQDHNEQGYQDQIYDEDDQLSEQSGSIDDLQGINDGLFFVVNQQGQLAQINAEDLLKNQGEQSQQQQQRQSEQIKIQQKLSKDADDVLSLPQLKQINSKIQAQLTGKQLNAQQMAKLLQIAIIKLFSLSSYQLKHKPVLSFYKDLIASNKGKIFVDTFITVLRIDQIYQDNQRYELAKKLNKTQLGLAKALGNFFQIAYDLSSQQSKQSKDINKLIKDQVRELLPVGDQIMIKSNIPMQDNFLTLLIFYSRYSQKSVHDKLKKLLSILSQQQQNKPYQLNKTKAALLTKHIYRNNNSSSIWNNIEQNFGVNIEMKTKFSSCLVVYGKMLRQDIEKCYNDLLQIVKNKEMGESQNMAEEGNKQKNRQILKQQEKKVQQNLRMHFKRIKHYYYWNKRNIINELDKQQNKPVKLLKNTQLIKLTQLMIFYCHFIKQQFFQKIDEKAMKNLLVLPKSVIQTSFMFLWKLKASIQKWQPLSMVKQYFKNYKLYQHKFQRLEQACNLILEFLQMPQFSNSKFKQVIIPYFINHPNIAHEIPLIFKIPDIPQELNGQKVYLTRQCSFDMAFYQWMTSSFLVQYHNQQGSDHGGMVRELMMGWTGLGIGEQHIFIGKILAFSFKKSIPYGGKFDLAMAIAITQFKVTLQFLQQVDPEVCQNLKYIRDQDPQDLQMKFVITKQQFGVIKHYPLIPGGEDITITNQNKKQYLQLYLANYFLVGREWEMSQLCTGFFSIVNKKYAAIFNPFQMIQKIQGQQINDYTKLKNKTKYEQGYTQSSQMIKWFWQIVAQFNQKQMNRFLQFITGAPKVSIYNHSFTFVIEKPYGQNENRLPVAHTCFNTLQLPQYKTKEILEKKLHQAVFEGNDTFGIM